MLICPNCQGRFFKLLEYRYQRQPFELYSKRRCKRCKEKHFFKKRMEDSSQALSSLAEWSLASPLDAAISKRVMERGRIFVGDYTQKISRSAEASIHYLKHADSP